MSTYVTYLPSTSLTLPSQAGQAGKYLYTDGTSLSWATPVTQTITSGVTATSPSENAVYSALAAKVAGPAAATDLNIAIFDGVTGKLIKDSVGWSISSGNLLSTADGTYNIGAPSASRPGRVYAKTAINLDSLTINTILSADASRNIVSLDTAVYPSLTELSYVKGVTSSIQTQLNGKQASGNYITALTSDVTASGPGSAAATISNNVVTNAKLFQMVNNTIKGNVSGSTGAPSDLTGTQVTAILDSFSGSLKGLVPVSLGGSVNFLRADGTWAPAGVSPGTAEYILYTNSAASATEWAINGRGPSGSSYPTNSIILGRVKPVGMSAQNTVLAGVGANAGAANDSVAIGYNAYANDRAVAIGSGASVTNNANGYQSVAVGYSSTATGEAGVTVGSNASGQRNSTVIGFSASDAGNGVVIGKQASNTAQGAIVLGTTAAAASTGAIAIGYAANSGTSSASNSLVIGYNSGKSSLTGASNTVIGTNSFNSASLTSASTNTIIGQESAASLTTASGCVFLGYKSGKWSTTQGNELFIDNQDRVDYAGQQTKSLIYGVFNSTASSQTLTANSAFTATYGLNVSTVGYGLSVKGGSNAKIGKATFSGVSSVTVSTTAVTANSIILVTTQSGGYATMVVNNIVAGTSFDIQHNNSFTGTVAWIIVEIVP